MQAISKTDIRVIKIDHCLCQDLVNPPNSPSPAGPVRLNFNFKMLRETCN